MAQHWRSAAGNPGPLAANHFGPPCDECWLQEEEESRLEDQKTAFEMLGAKEMELVELLHAHQLHVSDSSHMEIAAAELHEAEVQSATERITELLLQHAKTQAAAIFSIAVSNPSRRPGFS